MVVSWSSGLRVPSLGDFGGVGIPGSGLKVCEGRVDGCLGWGSLLLKVLSRL